MIIIFRHHYNLPVLGIQVTKFLSWKVHCLVNQANVAPAVVTSVSVDHGPRSSLRTEYAGPMGADCNYSFRFIAFSTTSLCVVDRHLWMLAVPWFLEKADILSC